MARLNETERRQLTEARKDQARLAVRWPVRPIADYIAFATFAARCAPPKEFKPIDRGKHWKL